MAFIRAYLVTILKALRYLGHCLSTRSKTYHSKTIPLLCILEGLSNLRPTQVVQKFLIGLNLWRTKYFLKKYFPTKQMLTSIGWQNLLLMQPQENPTRIQCVFEWKWWLWKFSEIFAGLWRTRRIQDISFWLTDGLGLKGVEELLVSSRMEPLSKRHSNPKSIIPIGNRAILKVFFQFGNL